MNSVEKTDRLGWPKPKFAEHTPENCSAPAPSSDAVNQYPLPRSPSQDGGGDVKLQMGLHDESLERHYDLDVENPVARLYGAAAPARGDALIYEFTGAGDAKGHAKTATLMVDVRAMTASLTLDGVNELCMTWGIFRR